MNYPANESAQGLASLGRYGDTMLVHMNPKEVAGLQQLAMSKGGTLTINPDTGMPEAFLGALFDFAAPIVGGYFGMNPWLMAGIMGGKSLVEGDDPLEAAMSAFGGYSGAKLGSGIKDFSTPLKVPTAELNSIQQATSNIEAMDPKNLMQADKGFGLDQGIKGIDTTPFNKIATGVQAPNLNPPGTLSGYPLDTRQPFAPETGEMGTRNIAFADTFKPPQVTVPNAMEATSPIGQFGTDVGNVFKDPMGFAKQVGEGDALMGGAKIGMYTASPFLESALKPEEFRMATSEQEQYDPNRSLYLSNDTNLRLLPNLNLARTAKEGGEIKAYAIGGNVVDSGNPSVGGGISDLYSKSYGQTGNISADGFGIGRLNTLASQESLENAKTLGYKLGGYLDGAGDGMSDSIPATIEGKQPARLADGEFVIPADVVSHLGNGSSKAGSKRLYAMLDKVRKARTGNTKQGKQIKPEKYMPA